MKNIRDVAAAAHVSISTVSAVLKGEKYVSPHLKARVLAAMEQLGYTPKKRGRQRPRAALMVCVILPGIYSSFFPPLLNGITEAATEFGYTIQLSDSCRSWEKERELVRALIARGVNDLILDSVCPLSDEEAYFEEIRSAMEPRGGNVVVLSRALKSDFFYQIYVDNYTTSYEATEHLIALGHRQIAHICGSDVFPHSALRARGYRTALLDHGIAVDEHLVLKGDFSPLSGYAAMDEFFAKGLKATAVFSANDQMAVGAVKAIRRQGLRVPEDVAVAGFDNLFVAGLIEPNLTTVQYPIYQMGYLAVRLLSERRQGQKPPLKTRLNARLIVRRSTDTSKVDDLNLQKW
ncbi:LacI family DNA-binding transcriptional regulator [Bacillota bacterium Meth-B3]|nr:LacI family DNA-binding transcriptional regulator [Christensenellaceae bacterium]MEA5065057.1 LacI family DNA-binding transcriptional regulator [Eubacteriales bacterium]MEA5068930.1 LacI family DNA-binding transcriptional regulator [Christensenellaceae bacterium]